MTIEIEPRPTVLGDLPFAFISDAATKTTGVRCLWPAVCPRGLSQWQKSPAADIHTGNMETLFTGMGVQNLKIPLLFRLLSTMSSAMKVSSLLTVVMV